MESLKMWVLNVYDTPENLYEFCNSKNIYVANIRFSKNSRFIRYQGWKDHNTKINATVYCLTPRNFNFSLKSKYSKCHLTKADMICAKYDREKVYNAFLVHKRNPAGMMVKTPSSNFFSHGLYL